MANRVTVLIKTIGRAEEQRDAAFNPFALMSINRPIINRGHSEEQPEKKVAHAPKGHLRFSSSSQPFHFVITTIYYAAGNKSRLNSFRSSARVTVSFTNYTPALVVSLIEREQLARVRIKETTYEKKKKNGWKKASA